MNKFIKLSKPDGESLYIRAELIESMSLEDEYQLTQYYYSMGLSAGSTSITSSLPGSVTVGKTPAKRNTKIIMVTCDVYQSGTSVGNRYYVVTETPETILKMIHDVNFNQTVDSELSK